MGLLSLLRKLKLEEKEIRVLLMFEFYLNYVSLIILLNYLYEFFLFLIIMFKWA